MTYYTITHEQLQELVFLPRKAVFLLLYSMVYSWGAGKPRKMEIDKDDLGKFYFLLPPEHHEKVNKVFPGYTFKITDAYKRRHNLN